MRFFGVRERFGFPRLGSEIFLTRSLTRPQRGSHRYEDWRALGLALDLKLPDTPPVRAPQRQAKVDVVLHTGAARWFCIWPLENFQQLVARLRARGHSVRVLCDPAQQAEWVRLGEPDVIAPRTVTELIDWLQDAAVFVGNDSGPGHLAALSGVPTFTLFGPHLPEGWMPLHPSAEWNPGRPCPFKPCETQCRIGVHRCMVDVGLDDAWAGIEPFVLRHCGRRQNAPVAVRSLPGPI
jgi:ADP-heptose:LPS heptosyltransferase